MRIGFSSRASIFSPSFGSFSPFFVLPSSPQFFFSLSTYPPAELVTMQSRSREFTGETVKRRLKNSRYRAVLYRSRAVAFRRSLDLCVGAGRQVIKRETDEFVSIDDYRPTGCGHRTPFLLQSFLYIGLRRFFSLFENFAIRKPTIYWSIGLFIRKHCTTVMLLSFPPNFSRFHVCQVKIVVAFQLNALLFFHLRPDVFVPTNR